MAWITFKAMLEALFIAYKAHIVRMKNNLIHANMVKVLWYRNIHVLLHFSMS
jgi:hypothetical protein